MPILKEHGPKDIINAYKASGDEFDFDFENSKFTIFSKEEALRMLKDKQCDKIKLVINPYVISLSPEGFPMTFTRYSVGIDKKYTDDYGNSTTVLKEMPASHLIKIADKIFSVDRKQVDPEKRDKRYAYKAGLADASDNSLSWYLRASDSRGWKEQPYDSATWSVQKQSFDTEHNGKPINKIKQDYEEQVNEYKDKIAHAQEMMQKINTQLNKLNLDDETRETLQKKFEQYNKTVFDSNVAILQLTRQLKRDLNTAKDIRAALRYSYSADALQGRIQAIKTTLRKARTLQRKIDTAATKIDMIKVQGAPTTTSRRAQLENATIRLNELAISLADTMSKLENADEYDNAALAELNNRYEQIENEINSTKSLVDKLAAIRNRRVK